MPQNLDQGTETALGSYVHVYFNQSPYRDATNEELLCLGPIQRINLLIGPTNSGKSRLLRAIAKLAHTGSRPYVLYHRRDDLRNLRESHQAIDEALPGATDPTIASLRKEILGRLPESDASLHAPDAEDNLKYMAEQVRRDPAFVTPESRLDGALRRLADQPMPKPSRSMPASIVYVPTLRTTHTLHTAPSGVSTDPDTFKTTTATNYELSPPITIFTGLGLYAALKSDKFGDPSAQNRVLAFEKFIGDTFFDGETVVLTPTTVQKKNGSIGVTVRDRQNVQQVIEHRVIHDMGDGINALLTLLYPLFVAPADSWIFIEEPEIFLHPGLQRQFFEILKTSEVLKSHRIFMTTHSNHLMELTLRDPEHVAIFSFERRDPADAGAPPTFAVAPVVGPGHDVLASLGVTNSSVLLANCTIWVEGITDRRYVKTFLRCFLDAHPDRRRFLEDLHYAFFEFAGSNVEHYAFSDDTAGDVARIRAYLLSSRIFLLHDRDGGHRERFARLKEDAKTSPSFRFYPTIGREIENELGASVLRLALPELSPQLFGSVSDGVLGTIAETDYVDEPLGQYLGRFAGNNGSASSLMVQSGTLDSYYKSKLAQLVDAYATWDNIGARARALVGEVYDFIERSNVLHSTKSANAEKAPGSP